MLSLLDAAGASRAASSVRALHGLAPRVLLVDDCAVQRLLGMALLSSLQITPVIACDGAVAIRRAAEQDFDIILMDLDMPGVDGFAATRSIRWQEAATGRRTPIVAYTASESMIASNEWSGRGIDAILIKPSPAPVMAECLVRWCPAIRQG